MRIRFVLLAAVALSLLTIAVRVSQYPALLNMPGGLGFVLEASGVLLAYGVVILWARGSRARLLVIAAPLGLIGAAVQITHQSLETAINFGEPWNGIVTLLFMLGTFLLWAVAGYRASRELGTAGAGALAGSWGAVVTMAIAVTFGLVFELYLATPRLDYVSTWAEFQRSGWTDVRASAIANTLDSALSHLIIGPIVGAIFGGVAGLSTRLRGNRQTTVSQS